MGEGGEIENGIAEPCRRARHRMRQQSRADGKQRHSSGNTYMDPLIPFPRPKYLDLELGNELVRN